jgi:hypothetical protein
MGEAALNQEPVEISEEKQMPSLASRAVVARLSIKLMGLTERDERASKKVNDEFLHVRQDAGHYQKVRLDRKDIAELLSVVEKSRGYYREQTRPFGDDGVRLLPVTKVFEYTKEMGNLKRNFEEALDFTQKNWEAIIQKQADRLEHLFDPKKYPTAEAIKKKFRMEWSILPVPDWTAQNDTSHVLLQIDEDLANDIREQVKEDQMRVLYESQDALWNRLLKVVNHVAVKYANPDTQVYRSSLVNIEKTMDIVKDLNFTDDPDIEAICREIDDTLLGWTALQVRKDPDLKLRLARRAEAICDKIKARMEAGMPVT